ncbi:MAG: hypothetical protein QNK35_12530, partial [Bacteroides sp.]|nr:hypothetical protein [Bacteroides sp.]
MKRKEFLQRSFTFAAGTMILGSGSSTLFGASTSRRSLASIETILLNNGIKIPILGFGTLYLNGEEGVK